MAKELISILVYVDDNSKHSLEGIFESRYMEYITDETHFLNQTFEADIVVASVDNPQILSEVKRLAESGIQVVAVTCTDDVNFVESLLDLGVMEVITMPSDPSTARGKIMTCANRARFKNHILQDKTHPMYERVLKLSKTVV